MRILFYNWRDILDPLAGGAEAYIHEIGKRLARDNEVYLYCRRYRGSESSSEIDGIKIIRKGGSFSLYVHAIYDYIFKLRKKNFDVVVDGINGVPFFTPLFVRKPKVAIIFHVVGKEIFFRELPFPLALVGWIAENVIPFIYKKVSFVAISDSTKDEMIRFGIPQHRISLVYCGVECAAQRDYSGVERSAKPSIVYVGRVKDYKQLDHLVQAFAVVNKEVPDSKLIIAGRGNYAELVNLADELGVSQGIEFKGEVSEEEKVDYLKSAWVFVTPSFKEGWGITVIEANSCGTPAIAYNTSGLRDSIKNGETGLLVSPGDIPGLAEAILRVIGDSDLRLKLSQSALEWAKGFTWDNSAKEFAKVIGGVVSGE